ncbi:hypothetical protein ACA910_013505 [Epithemia clementina (nom. ined.)]
MSSSSNDGTAYGANMNQEDMMESDQLIVVDQNDILVPNVELSKRAGHTFNANSPRATLHRAFSFFLFDKTNKMLLTQRAGSKITFPNVWTNTCCSHPLYGMQPDEVDKVPDAYPHFPGIKSASLRKLKHELGLNLLSYIDNPNDDIKFLTRFHYWASDTVTYGKEAPWGEHEVDYVLFCKIQHDSNDISVLPNPDEVSTYKFVSIDELKAMLEDNNLLWSPWFRGFMDRGIWDWWADMDGSLAGKYTNDNVDFFDPPPEHFASYNLPSHGRLTGVLPSSSSSHYVNSDMYDVGFLDAKSAASLDEELMSTPGFCLEQLMELAGLAVAEATYAVVQDEEKLRQQEQSVVDDPKKPIRILCICGPGNNGGDGLVAARHLKLFGYETTVVYPKRSAKQPHYNNLVHQCQDMGIPVLDEMPSNYKEFRVVIDAIFGFSFQGEPREPFTTILTHIQEAQKDGSSLVIAVDVPSGWHVDDGDVLNTGYVPEVLVSLTTPKLSAKNYPKRHFVGGRFLPPALAKKYNVRMPPYPGVAQAMEVSNGG